MRRRDALAALGVIAVSSRAHAWPVRTGRYAELAHGIDPTHPEPGEHGGASRAGQLIGDVPMHEPRIVWTRDSDPAARARSREPIVASDGTIAVGTGQGLSVIGMDGAERFAIALGPLDGAPALMPGDGIVAISRGGRAVVVSRAGSVRAQAELGFGVSESPLVLDDGSMIVAGTDRSLRRIDPSLSERWRVELPNGIGKAPTRDGDRVIVVAGEDLVVVSFDGETERVIPLGGRAHASASRAESGRLWVPLVEGELVAIDERRRVAQRIALGARMGTAERVAIAPDGSLRVPKRQHGLAAIGASGTWPVPAEFAFDFPARVDRHGVTLAADRGPRLVAIESDGTVRWRARLPMHVMSGAIVTRDGAIVCVGMEGSVFVMR
ncbi:PQQ-like beta-propeller repeat protein [Sandaracinus amylolyticus]|uniref:PQQ-like beta-propeller repeat protein n=1 Tax=Sandaracinus amylolyticus TaxID=927083 RepID=UPI001F2CCADB|nr:PQQ-like beta-propeller repeat protein [Sandaracinus amylolyticus]UJR79451.1 Cell surface protein [Sandaracinus amylolyticus]